jgi:ankyrin repeat protein
MRLVTLLCCALLVSCGGPRLKKLAGHYFIDDVAPGKPVRLYWVKDGRTVIVDREIRSIQGAGGCITYETSRPSVARALYAVLPEKTPVAAAASDAFRPWRLSPDGARRFDPPKTDTQGVTTLGMDKVWADKMCNLAYRQPPFREDWAAHDPQDFARVEIEHTDFDVHGADSVNNSTLSEQVRLMQIEVVEELIRAGADVNAPNDAGITPLMTAIQHHDRSTPIMRLLLDARAVVDQADDRGQTALMHAAKYGQKEAVVLLLERGADPTHMDKDGRTAAAMTGNSGNAAELTELLERAAAARRARAGSALQ